MPRRGCIWLIFFHIQPTIPPSGSTVASKNADVIENLNQSILCFVFNDFNNSYEKLLQEINQSSLRARRINDMLILVFLALNNAAPSYISDLFTERQTSIYSCEANAD